MSAGDRHQPLVAVLLGLVDLDHTATQVPDLVDLRTTLSDDGANHIVGDVDLLCQWLTGHDTTDGRGRRWATPSLSSCRLWCTVGCGLVRASASVRGVRGSTVVHRGLSYRSRSGRAALEVGNAITAGRAPVGVRVVTLEGVGMAVLTTGWLRHVRHNLHASGHSTGRTAAAGGIRRRRGSAKALRQLLNKGHCNIVGSDVHSVGNAKDYKGPLSRQGQAGIGSVEARTRGLLDLADATSTFANDRTNKDMGDQQTQGVCLGLGSGRGIKGLVVQGTNDQTEGLASGLARGQTNHAM